MPTTSTTRDSAESVTLVHVPVGQLARHPDNPRRKLGELAELAKSINAHGVLEPLLVVPVDAFNAGAGDDAISNPAVQWVIVAGHRRHAGAVKAKVDTVPAVPRPDLGDRALALEVMVLENFQRADLTPTEEAAAFRKLRDAGRSQRDIAARLGCAQSHVSKRLALLDLPKPARTAIDTGWLQLADAAELLRLRKHPDQLAALVDDLLSDGGPNRPTGDGLRAAVDAELASIRGRDNARTALFQQTCGAEPGPALDPDDAPDTISGNGITVRRVESDRGEPDRPSAPTPAAATSSTLTEAAAETRRQMEAAEIARADISGRIVARFLTDPTTALPWLTANIITVGDGGAREQYTDSDLALAWLHEAWLQHDGALPIDEDDLWYGALSWLDRHGDPALRLQVAGALAIAAAETRIQRHSYDGYRWDVHDLAHLDRLTDAGHQLNEWEQQRAAAAETTHDRCKRVPGCTEPLGHPHHQDELGARA